MIYGGWHPFLFSADATVPDSSLRSRSDASANRQWVERLERFTVRNRTVAEVDRWAGTSFDADDLGAEVSYWRSAPTSGTSGSSCSGGFVTQRVKGGQHVPPITSANIISRTTEAHYLHN